VAHLPGLAGLRVMSGDGHLVAEVNGPAASVPPPHRLVIGIRARHGGQDMLFAFAFDRGWVAELYAALGHRSWVSSALLDGSRRRLLQSGSTAIVSGSGHVLPACVCVETAVPGTGFVLVVGSPRALILLGWEGRTLTLALLTSIVVALLLLLSARIERLDVREARRLALLSDSTAELVNMTDRDILLRRLVEDASTLVRGVAFEVMPCGEGVMTAPDTLVLPLPVRRPEAACCLVGRAGRLPNLSGVERGMLDQLAQSAAVALDSIALIQERDRAAHKADANRVIAERARSAVLSVLEAMPDALVAVDEDWRVILTNGEAERLLKPPPVAAEVGETLLWERLPDAVHDEMRHRLRPPAGTGAAQLPPLIWPSPEGAAAGERPALRSIVVRAVEQRAGGLTIVLQDVSREVRAEEALRQAGKLDAVGRLTGGIAHDFNNLLTVIIGNLEMIEMDAQVDEDTMRSATEALQASRSAAELTRQLLAFARKQPLTPIPTDIPALLQRIAGLLRSSAGGRIATEFVLPPHDTRCTVLVDPTQLQNALINMAVNARDAMPDGGRLRFVVTMDEIGADGVPPHVGLRPGHYVRIQVADTGCGIPPDTIDRVFEPFFTTKPAGAGTGLGLSMVYGFAKQSHGDVSIRSCEGAGTTVELLLPCQAAEPQEAPRPGDRQEAAASRFGGRVLLVEDVDLVRAHAARMLERLGFEVAEAQDADQARAGLEVTEPPDLLLTDMVLPGTLNGRELAELLRKRWPNLPVLFMSGFVDGNVLEGALDAQGTAFLPKPFSLAQLLERLRLLLPSQQVDSNP